MIEAGTRTCPACGRRRPAGDDFCVCGAYLAWSDAEIDPAGASDPGDDDGDDDNNGDDQPTGKIVPVALLTVTAGTTVFQAGQDLAVPVAPGAVVEMVAMIRNTGRVVDTYTLRVEGVPPAWVELPAPTVHLMPVGEVGDYEARLPLRIRVPLSSEAVAERRPVRFVLHSGARDCDVASVPGALTIGPFFGLVLAARPAIVRGRRSAAIRAEVRNSGNTPVVPQLVAADGENACTFVVPELPRIEPGATAATAVRVSAKLVLYGRERLHEVTVGAVVPGRTEPAPTQRLSFRQKPLIPWWVPVAAVALAGLAVALWALLSSERKVEVPALRGASSAFVAQRALQQAGFTSPPVVRTRIVPGKKSGTVLDQAPEQGKRVDPATVVTIRVAVPPATTIIPDLRGTLLRAADGTLSHTHLRVGTVVPSARDGSREIIDQTPRPGNVRPRGTAVNLVVEGPGKVTVPDVKCITILSAEKRLARRGLQALNLADFTDTETIVTGQIPAAGERRAPRTSVELLFDGTGCDRSSSSSGGGGSGSSSQTGSSGAGASTASAASAAPSTAGLSYDDGNAVRTARATGVGRQAAWSPGGSLRAAVASTGKVVVSGGGMAPRAVPMAAGKTAAAPAFLAGGAAPAVAFVTTATGGDGAVCLAPAARGSARCLQLPGMVPRAVAPAPGGTRLLVVAAPAGQPDRPGVLTLTTTTPGATDPAAYRGGSVLARPRAAGGAVGAIFAVAFRAGDGVVAVTTDVQADGRLGPPGVALADPAQLATLAGARWIGRRACQVAFDRAGARLAVARGAAAAGTPCPARAVPGRIVVLAADGGGAAALVTGDGADPSWGPQP